MIYRLGPIYRKAFDVNDAVNQMVGHPEDNLVEEKPRIYS